MNLNTTGVIDLKKMFGNNFNISIDSLEKALSNDDEFNLLMPKVKSDPRLLNMFHELYTRIKNNRITVTEGLIRRIKVMDSLYYELLKEQTNTSLNYNEVQNKIFDRLFEIKNKSLEGYKYEKEALELITANKMFSLNEFFKEKKEIDLGAGTLITPLQNVSVFNDIRNDGVIENDTHENKFKKIVKSIYGKEFEKGFTNQDIQIWYANFKNEYMGNIVGIFIPPKINSFQRRSLEILNKELKKIEKKTGKEFLIDCQIVNFVGKDLEQVGSSVYSIEELLNAVTIDDDTPPKYEELYLIGTENYINHYNDSEYKINISNNLDVDSKGGSHKK